MEEGVVVTVGSGLLVLVGAMIGAPARYLIDRWLQSSHGTGFPWGTFTVNMIASFGLALISGLVANAVAAPALGVVIGTGFCATLSTWSTLAYESVRLVEEGARAQAVFNVVVSVLAGLGAVGLGFAVAVAW